MKMKAAMKTLTAAFAFGLLATPWAATAQTPSTVPNAAAIIQKIQALPNFPAIKDVRPLASAAGAVLEITAERGQIFYTDPQARVLFMGPAIEVATGKNLTSARQDELAPYSGPASLKG